MIGNENKNNFYKHDKLIKNQSRFEEKIVLAMRIMCCRVLKKSTKFPTIRVWLRYFSFNSDEDCLIYDAIISDNMERKTLPSIKYAQEYKSDVRILVRQAFIFA